MLQRVTLVGYRASGKSTIGPLLALRLGWRFIDADRDLEQRFGQSIAAFFAAEGEAAFREREQDALADLLAGEAPLVLATGGGVVLREANRACLRQRGGLVVYLHAPVSVLQSRLRAHAAGRPSLSGQSVWEEVPHILAERDPLYREVSELVLDASRPPSDNAATVLKIVENPGRKPVDNSSKPSAPNA